MINKITPVGNLDQENDIPFIKKGDYRDALDVSSISDGNGNTLSWEPKTQNTLAFDIGEINSIRCAKWIITFLDDPSAGSATIYFQRPGQITEDSIIVSGNTSGAVMATAFYNAVILDPLYAVNQLSPTSIEVQFDFTSPWDVTVLCVSNYVTLEKIQDPIDASMFGQFTMCGGKDLLGDLFIMSTTSTTPPEEFNVVAIVNSGGLVEVVLDRDHGIAIDSLVFIYGVSPLTEEWVVYSTSSNSVTLYHSTYSGPYILTNATLSYKVKTLSRVGVAVEDINGNGAPSNPIYNYTVLLESSNLNFRLQNRIHLYCEEEGFRKSFYWCDGNNKDRSIYYTQENYVTNGFIVNNGGIYDLSNIDLSSRLLLPNLNVNFQVNQVLDNSGALLSGNYRYAIRFLNDYFVGTEWSDLTNIVNIYSAPFSNPVEIHGDQDGTVTGKGVELYISNIPVLYKYYEIAYVRYSNNNYFSDAFRNKVTSKSFYITHTGRETSVPFNVDSLNAQNAIYETSHSIDALDNRLVRSNLSSSLTVDFTDFFKTIQHEIRRDTLDTATFSVTNTFDGETFNEYRDPENVYSLKTFVPNETYRFSARVKMKNGNIVNQNFWVDDIRIDDNPVNVGNVFNDNRRNPPSWSGIDYTDSSRKPWYYYINFQNIDWSYPVGGKTVGELVDEIYFDFVEMNDSYREVLASGIMIMSSSQRDDMSHGGYTLYSHYGAAPGRTDWGPWTGYNDNPYWGSETNRYKPGGENWGLQDTSYWITSNCSYTAPNPPLGPFGIYTTTASTVSTIQSGGPTGTTSGADYFVVIKVKNPFTYTTTSDIRLFENGNYVDDFHVTNSPAPMVYGDDGYYAATYTASGNYDFTIEFGAGLTSSVDVEIVAIIRRRTLSATPYDDAFSEWYHYHKYIIVNNTSVLYRANPTVGFFISPDIHYDQTSISFVPGDEIINQKQLVDNRYASPFGFTPVGRTFSQNDIGQQGINGGCLSESVYDEYAYSDDDGLPYLSTSITDASELLPFGYVLLNQGLNQYYANNSVELDYGPGTKGYYSAPKCMAVYLSSPAMYGYVFDTGIMRCQYYRSKGYGAKFGNIEASTYVYSGFSISNKTLNYLDVYGDQFSQNTFVKLRTSNNGAYSGPQNYSVWGWGYGTGMYSFNRGNYQMEYVLDTTVGCPPNIYPTSWLESKQIYFGGYTNGYSDRFDIKYTNSYNPDTQVGDIFPTRIAYSNVKPNGSFSDEYRTFPLLNFRDLNLSDGEIVHHENGNGELLTWQRKSFQRQNFNSSGLITVSNDMDVVVGSGGVLPTRGLQISSLGTTHKWSIAKGRSQGGKDMFAWINSDLGEFVRFGYDGTVPIAQIQNMMSSLRDKIYWAKNKYTPSADLGIRSIWDDTYKSFHFVVRGVRENAGEWDPYTVYTGVDEVYVYAYDNLSSQLPRVFVLNVGSSVGQDPLSGSSDWLEVEGISGVNIDYSMMKGGFQSFHSWLPKTMLQWGRTFVSAPVHYGRYVYIHNSGGTEYAYPLNGEVATNPYITAVCVLDYNTKTTFDAVELNSSLLPLRIDFKTDQHQSYLNTIEFEKDEIHDDLWAAPIKNDSTISIDNPLGVNDIDTSFLFGQYLLATYKFDPVQKSKLFNFILKLTPMSRLNNS